VRRASGEGSFTGDPGKYVRHVGNTYDLVYSKAHPPKFGAIPPAEIGGTPLK